MLIKELLKKNIGKGISISFIDGDVEGIIVRNLHPNFLEIDFCCSGKKIQYININNIENFSIITDKEEIKELIEPYK